MTLTAPTGNAATANAPISQPVAHPTAAVSQSQPVAQQPAAQSQPAQASFPVDEETLNNLVAISGASKEQCRAAL